MGKRRQAKALRRWETSTRLRAIELARKLALDLYDQRPPKVAPYGIGVVLDPGEIVLAETPMRFDLDPISEMSHLGPAAARQNLYPFRPWLITNTRVVARLGDDRLHGWRWEHATGLRADLTPSYEYLALDTDATGPLIWRGPALAPLAVAAVFHLHGPHALLEHPALAELRRADPKDAETDVRLQLTR